MSLLAYFGQRVLNVWKFVENQVKSKMQMKNAKIFIIMSYAEVFSLIVKIWDFLY